MQAKHRLCTTYIPSEGCCNRSTTSLNLNSKTHATWTISKSSRYEIMSSCSLKSYGCLTTIVWTNWISSGAGDVITCCNFIHSVYSPIEKHCHINNINVRNYEILYLCSHLIMEKKQALSCVWNEIERILVPTYQGYHRLQRFCHSSMCYIQHRFASPKNLPQCRRLQGLAVPLWLLKRSTKP